jgi:conjugal transfer pilus assembly protein TraB
MSEPRKGLGLFVNKRAGAQAPAGTPSAAPHQKDVRKRWLMVGAGAVAFVVLASSMFSSNNTPAPRPSAAKDAPVLSTTPRGAAEADWRAQSQQDITTARQQAEAAQAEARKLREDIANLRDLVNRQSAANTTSKPVPVLPPPGIVAPPVPGLANAPGAFEQPAPPAPPTPPTGGARPNTPPAAEPPAAAPMVFEAPRAAESAGERVKAKVSFKKNPNSGLLPAGSFAPVALLNGLDAGTSSATQSNPMPVLMNIGEHARLPGAARYQLRSCFVLGTGHGDLSAERVYVRISRLSCVDRSDRLVLSQEVAGYLVDSDGKLGLRGVVTDRQGSRLGKALLAGFAQGLSGALGQAQGTLSSSVLGTTNSIGGSDALRASGLSGAQAAASQLAQWYLKEAQSIFPVISVDAGRTGTIVFTNSASLAWGSGEAQFQKDVRPE